MKLLLLLGASCLSTFVSAQTQPSCDSKVFCQGDLLHTVQMARIFNDSKSFVDLRMVDDEATTLANFDKFLNETNNEPTREQVKKFVDANFEAVNEFDDWTPPDFTDSPQFLSRIQDQDVRNFAQDLVNIWPVLARRIKQEVLESPQFYTLLPVEKGFVVPGGRFREFYYWDSYWIIKGLLLSEMKDTVKGMLDNFLSLVERYGFVPNGARIYYLNRSQPPLLNLMVAAYIEATNDTAWLADNVHILDKELRFWLNNRVVEVQKNGVTYELAHYDSDSGSPRPESYYEDVNTAAFFQDENDRRQLYADLKTGAESGFDFSSRWIVDDKGGIDGNLTRLRTRWISPVDLNSFLCQAFRKLSEFYVILQDFNNATLWLEKSNIWRKNIKEVMYDEEDGIWYDWDMHNGRLRRYFTPSNFAPLWAECFDPATAEELGLRAAQYLRKQGVMDYQGGIPTTLSQTGEQWDYPNAWPPLQHIVIMGLDQSGNCDAKNISKEFAGRWIKANMIGFNNTNEMFEKYDAEQPGRYGGGGEYTVQAGFGWTNGVALDIINKYFTQSKKRS